MTLYSDPSQIKTNFTAARAIFVSGDAGGRLFWRRLIEQSIIERPEHHLERVSAKDLQSYAEGFFLQTFHPSNKSDGIFLMGLFSYLLLSDEPLTPEDENRLYGVLRKLEITSKGEGPGKDNKIVRLLAADAVCRIRNKPLAVVSDLPPLAEVSKDDIRALKQSYISIRDALADNQDEIQRMVAMDRVVWRIEQGNPTLLCPQGINAYAQIFLAEHSASQALPAEQLILATLLYYLIRVTPLEAEASSVQDKLAIAAQGPSPIFRSHPSRKFLRLTQNFLLQAAQAEVTAAQQPPAGPAQKPSAPENSTNLPNLRSLGFLDLHNYVNDQCQKEGPALVGKQAQTVTHALSLIYQLTHDNPELVTPFSFAKLLAAYLSPTPMAIKFRERIRDQMNTQLASRPVLRSQIGNALRKRLQGEKRKRLESEEKRRLEGEERRTEKLIRGLINQWDTAASLVPPPSTRAEAFERGQPLKRTTALKKPGA